MSLYTYRHIWPVLDEGLTLRELAAEAKPELDMAIAAAGVSRCGKVIWEIATDADGDLVLVAAVPCSRLTPRKRVPELVDAERVDEWEFDRALDGLGLTNLERTGWVA